jgi:phosphatidylglycerol:prolipoprotein diacylglycerol transferase
MLNYLASLPYPNFDPVALRIGPLVVRWYGLAYLAGFFIAYMSLRQMIRSGSLRIARDGLSDLIGWLAFGVIAGGRTGWWVFYSRHDGAVELWYEPFALWHGGMSFHGGLIGVVTALSLWSWRKRAPFWNLADCLAFVTPLGLFLGRIANFINAELVGRPTSVPWGVIFPGESIARHPSQLYEALLEGPMLLLAMTITRRVSVRREGRGAALFLIFYGVIRFTVEFTRQPDPQIGFIAFDWLTMGQLLSAGLVAAGVILFVYRGRSTIASDQVTETRSSTTGPHSSTFRKERIIHA